jgi:hypothetical protein
MMTFTHSFQSNAKKVPKVLLSLEQFELEVQKLLEASKNAKGFSKGTSAKFVNLCTPS